jgi:hypothetical protein
MLSATLSAITVSLLSIVVIETLKGGQGDTVLAFGQADTDPAQAVSREYSVVALLRTTFGDQAELVNTYKPYLKPSDHVSSISASIDPTLNMEFVSQLPGIKGVIFYSLDEVKSNAKVLKDSGFDFIGYDLESDYTSSDDLLYPVGSMRTAYEVAHQNGLKFMALPGYPFDSVEAASAFANYSDMYVIQAQPQQEDPQAYREFVTSRADALLSANPDITIITELSSEQESVDNMKECFSLVAGFVNGVTLWYNNDNESISDIREFLAWFNQQYR